MYGVKNYFDIFLQTAALPPANEKSFLWILKKARRSATSEHLDCRSKNIGSTNLKAN